MTSVQTYSGEYLDLLAPHRCEFSLIDIAHALGNTCRFGGHVSQFYSVAQHSVLVSELVPHEHAWCALMHDAAEAFVGDIPSPLKDLLPDYHKIERRVHDAIRHRFNVPPITYPVKQADLVMLATERRDLMAEQTREWPLLHGIQPMRQRISVLYPRAATQAFLARAQQVAPSNIQLQVA
jgi:5'-deoxynucleotidase YfbR-like HD superfamily hydrolase